MSKPEISPGLAFMQAAANALPRTMGDRVAIGLLNDLMATAVENKFIFHPEDAQALNRLAIRTSVGVFRPMDDHFYRIACRHGGTYPKLWEKAYKTKPWIAPKAIVNGTWQHELKENNRVAPGIGVLVPLHQDSPAPELAGLDGNQVWWCTSMTDTKIILGLYYDVKRRGRPAHLKKLTRDEWVKWVAHETEVQTQ